MLSLCKHWFLITQVRGRCMNWPEVYLSRLSSPYWSLQLGFLAGGSSNQRWSPNTTHLWLCIYLLCKYTIIWHTAWQSANSTPALSRGRVNCFCKKGFWTRPSVWGIGCWMIYKSAELFPHSIAPSYPELIFCATDGCVKFGQLRKFVQIISSFIFANVHLNYV